MRSPQRRRTATHPPAIAGGTDLFQDVISGPTNSQEPRSEEVSTVRGSVGLISRAETWFASKGDSLTTIRALAADEPIECIETAAPDESRTTLFRYVEVVSGSR